MKKNRSNKDNFEKNHIKNKNHKKKKEKKKKKDPCRETLQQSTMFCEKSCNCNSQPTQY